MKRAQAEQLKGNKLLPELIESYVYNIFEQWKDEQDPAKREQLFARVHAAHDIQWWIQTKCEGMLDGSGNNSE